MIWKLKSDSFRAAILLFYDLFQTILIHIILNLVYKLQKLFCYLSVRCLNCLKFGELTVLMPSALYSDCLCLNWYMWLFSTKQPTVTLLQPHVIVFVHKVVHPVSHYMVKLCFTLVPINYLSVYYSNWVQLCCYTVVFCKGLQFSQRILSIWTKYSFIT